MIRKKRDAGYYQGSNTEGEDSRAGPKPKKTQISSRDPPFKDEHEMAQKRPRNAGALRKPINDTHDARIVHTWKKAMDAVGFIEGPCCTGTGFRVGKDKILTAYHVAEGITRKEKHSEPDRSLLETDDVCIKFNFLKGSDNLPTFYFEDELWGDKEMDFAVLQLRVKDKTTGACYPEGIKRFKHASPKNTFALLGHPDGKPMQWDPNVRILESNEGEKRLKEMKTYWSSKPIGQKWGYPDSREERNVLFDCWVQHGASGSPGIEMASDGEPACSLMLIHGYPDFVFDKEKYQVVSDDHPYMIEQGVTMEAIANKLSKLGKAHKKVKEEIFADNF
ncbi:uncharacterized protein LOC117341087 isoform X1 [Pecten maximus]|uniref:uncharacterized protein LOC117341087 isoform X1 n=1 Tax=Pecten maximus TaxID=6579 RepID=UPI00145909CE|nr:uncharacterized protein LOC117341087 isoform X1 [Pecten maximus]